MTWRLNLDHSPSSRFLTMPCHVMNGCLRLLISCAEDVGGDAAVLLSGRLAGSNFRSMEGEVECFGWQGGRGGENLQRGVSRWSSGKGREEGKRLICGNELKGDV